jgi:hypothetical protein
MRQQSFPVVLNFCTKFEKNDELWNKVKVWEKGIDFNQYTPGENTNILNFYAKAHEATPEIQETLFNAIILKKDQLKARDLSMLALVYNKLKVPQKIIDIAGLFTELQAQL